MNFNAEFPTLMRFCLLKGYLLHVSFYAQPHPMHKMAEVIQLLEY